MADDPDDGLESTVERLRDRVDDLESQLGQESRSPATATRRDALKAGGAGALLGALGLGSITSGASADPQGRLGSATDPVLQAYVDQLGKQSERVTDAYINNADVTALSTEGLDIGGLSYLTHIGDYSSSNGSTLDISTFPSITGGTSARELILLVRYQDGGTEQDILLRFNGDGSATGNYTYVDESGTETQSANNIVLLTESASFGAGWLQLSISRAFAHIVSVDRVKIRTEKVESVAQRGTRTQNVDLNSMQLIPTAGTDAQIDARLFERSIV